VEEDPDTYRILKLRAEILELGSAIRQLLRAGLDDAAAQLLISRKRAQLKHLVKTDPCGRGRRQAWTRYTSASSRNCAKPRGRIQCSVADLSRPGRADQRADDVALTQLKQDDP
jgi:hypothetical protein